jgi:hypothetical protein
MRVEGVRKMHSIHGSGISTTPVPIIPQAHAMVWGELCNRQCIAAHFDLSAQVGYDVSHQTQIPIPHPALKARRKILRRLVQPKTNVNFLIYFPLFPSVLHIVTNFSFLTNIKEWGIRLVRANAVGRGS